MEYLLLNLCMPEPICRRVTALYDAAKKRILYK